MITTSNCFTRVFSNNYLHKSMLVKSLLHSIFHHIFRIFLSEDKKSKAIDKEVLKVLWSIPSLKDPEALTPCRTTIAKKRAGASIPWGALDIKPSKIITHRIYSKSLLTFLQWLQPVTAFPISYPPPYSFT